MSIDFSLVKKYEDVLNEIMNYIDIWAKKIDPENIEEMHNKNNVKLNNYPIEVVYNLSLYLNFLSGFFDIDNLEKGGLTQNEINEINKKYTEMSDRYVEIENQLRYEMATHPLPEAPLGEFQKLFLELDPYGSQVKSKLFDFKNKIAHLVRPNVTTPLKEPEVIDFFITRYINSTTIWDYEVSIPIKQFFEIRYLPELQYYDTEGNLIIEDTWSVHYRDQYGNMRSTQPDMAFYGTIPSVLDVFIQNHYKIFHEDLQIAKEKVKTFFEDLIYLEYINRVCMHGHNMQILADKIENIEHKYRNLLWQCGVALETRFDLRGVYQYRLFLDYGPKIRDEKDNLREKGVFEMYPTFNSDKYFIKCGENFPTSGRCNDHTTWLKGQEMYAALKRVIKEKTI